MVAVARGVDDVVRTRRTVLPGVPTGFAVNVAVAPVGNPLTENETAPAKPPTEDVVIVYDAVWPRVSVTEDGLALSTKSRAVTDSVTVAVRLVEPLVPLTFNEYVPGGAVAIVVIVSWEVPAPLTAAGLNAAVPTLVGRPLRDSATVPVNPLT